MQAKYGFINKEQFFRKTKNRFGNTNKGKSGEVFDLVSDLSKKEKIQIFRTFWRKSSNQEFLQQLTQDAKKMNNKRKIDDYLLDLHDYKIARPLIFALFCHYASAPQENKIGSAKFVYDCVKLLSSFVQRVTHIGNFRPSVYEAKFADLAEIISDGSCTTSEQFFDYLKTYDNAGVIDDTDYIEQMGTRFYSQKSITKSGYILRKIVEYQEKGVRIDNDQVSVEHILPRSNEHNSKNSWASKFDQNDRDRFVHCLGNLTLISKKDNSPKAKDNESFSAKKKIYAMSSYQLTKDICQHTEWTPKAVKHRQSKIAKIAAKQIWHFRLK
ncbi:HNH endonuclease family protein [Candidatus Spongiihabitans sp.]|uniref:HNH endonuclease family protein n=1 Tax=Candidatus Spongiihabitans sp. TaxID=3101308 RepID=UPI003C6F7DAA